MKRALMIVLALGTLAIGTGISEAKGGHVIDPGNYVGTPEHGHYFDKVHFHVTADHHVRNMRFESLQHGKIVLPDARVINDDGLRQWELTCAHGWCSHGAWHHGHSGRVDGFLHNEDDGRFIRFTAHVQRG